MNEIGKSLVFYLKYFPEMQEAFEKGREFQGVESATVEKIGKAAGLQAFDLLTACTADWVKQLESSKVANFKQSRKETVQRNWAIEINVRPRRQKSSAPLKRQIGIDLDRDFLIPWVWSRGGVAFEEKIKQLLPSKTESFGSKKYGWNGGSIAISPVNIPWDTAKDFRLDAANIINDAKKSLCAISPEFIEALLKL